MQNIHASIESGVLIADGSGYDSLSGSRFTTIWVGGEGDIALKNPNGSIYVIPGVPAGAFFQASGVFVGTLAQGTTATGLVACGWGTYDVTK